MRLIAIFIRILFSIFQFFPQQRKIALLSRQSACPFDFQLLEPYLSQSFPDFEIAWACLPSNGSFGVKTMLQQLWHASTSTVCLVDGYVPAISIPKHHRAFCMQVWHAPGALKRFGYQSVGTSDGRSLKEAKVLCMHRGYDCVIAGFPGAVNVYSEAFQVPVDKILPIGLPRMEYLTSDVFRNERAKQLKRAINLLSSQGFQVGGNRCVVLYAPTFRRAPEDPGWLNDCIRQLRSSLGPDFDLIVSGHPIGVDRLYHCDADQSCSPVYYLSGITTLHALPLADYVITDYSTIALESAVAKKRILFFTPDLEHYRQTPGLNIDPSASFPTLCFLDAGALADYIELDRRYGSYDFDALESFMTDYGSGYVSPCHSIDQIIQIIRTRIKA